MSAANPVPNLSAAYMENSRWLIQHLTELSRDHPDQWVAIYNGHVVAADPDLAVASTAALRIAPAEDTVVHFVDGGHLVLTTMLR